MPGGSGSSRHQRVGEAAEQVGLGTSCRKSETDAACGLNDAGSDFQQPQPDGGELGRCQIARLWDGVTNGEDEPIGGGVEDEANLVGERRAATGAVGGKLGLVQLDQVLGLAARAIEAVVDPLGGADAQVGDDIANIEPLLRGFDAGDDAPVAIPRACTVGGLGIAAYHRLVVDRSGDANCIGDSSSFRASGALPAKPKM